MLLPDHLALAGHCCKPGHDVPVALGAPHPLLDTKMTATAEEAIEVLNAAKLAADGNAKVR